MRTTRFAGLISLALPLLLATAASADTVTLKLLPAGAMPKLGGYRPQRLELSDKKPAALKKAPKDVTAPIYGTLTLGPKEKPSTTLLLVDEPDGKESRLFVDTNGNGDLTDDPAPEWKKRPYPGKDGKEFAMYGGGANVTIKYGGKPVVVHLGMYRFDKRDEGRAQLKNQLLYYSDYAYEGELKLGSKTYKVMLSDATASGDFRGKTSESGSGVEMLIDVNGNGKFEARGERYDIAKPFNIAGITYELGKVDASGSRFEVVKSEKAVAEILPPPDLSAGKKALVFETKTTDGKAVSFPSGYKGKLVMLDFWATWCGPCRAELPNLTAAYEKFHEKGFEVLGISLDQKDASEKLASFTKENKMPWPQIYDGKYWAAEIAQLYVVQSIPSAFLVDGDTGEIVASGNDLRGENLSKTLEKALASKK